MRLPGLPQLFARLLPSPDQGQGDAGTDAADLAQPALLSGTDAGPARRDCGGGARGIRNGLSRTESGNGIGVTELPMELIASDLDGTLLRHDGTLSTRTKDAVRAAVAAGYKVVLA